MKRVNLTAGCLLALFLSGVANAAPLNASKIGQVWTTTPASEVAFQALQGFRGAFTPINIGMAVGTYVIISTIGDGINALRVQMAAPLPAAQSPPGWAGSESPPVIANMTTRYSIRWGGNYIDWADSKSGACALAVSNHGGTVGSCVPIDGLQYQLYGNDGNLFETNTFGASDSCASGYELSSGSCNLATPSAVKWPSDGMATVTPVGGILTPNPRDPDNTPDLGTGEVHRSGTDEYNNPVEETITSNPANGIDYRRDTQSQNPMTGESVVQRDQYSTDANGLVTSVTSNVYNNSSVSSVNTSPQWQTDVSMLAKDSTLITTNTTLNAIKTELETPKPSPTAVGTARSISESNQLVKTAIFSHLPSPTFSDDVPECPTFSAVIPYLNFTMTLDQYCTLDPYIRPILNLASMAAFSAMALLIVLRA